MTTPETLGATSVPAPPAAPVATPGLPPGPPRVRNDYAPKLLAALSSSARDGCLVCLASDQR